MKYYIEIGHIRRSLTSLSLTPSLTLHFMSRTVKAFRKTSNCNYGAAGYLPAGPYILYL